VLGSLISALVGWQLYDISLLQPLEELSHKQRAYREGERRTQLQYEAVQHHLKLAYSFLDVGQLSPAKRELEAAAKLDPTNPEVRLGLLKVDVFEPVRDKNYVPEVAERRLRMILERSPEDPHVLSFLGDVYQALSEDKARGYYERAIAKHPGAASAYNGLAVLNDIRNRPDAALPHYLKAVELSPWNQHYLNNLAYQYLGKRDAGSAIPYYETLLTLNDQYLVAYYTLVIALRWVDRLDLAAYYDRRLLSLLSDPQIHASECNRGHWFFHAGSEVVFFELQQPDKRKYYAQLAAALTAHLRDDAARRDELLAAAHDVPGHAEYEDVKRLVQHDATLLVEQRPAQAHSVADFLKRLDSRPALRP